jgi:hypothetical protein
LTAPRAFFRGKAWFAVGLSRLSDVSKCKQSPDVGVPVELICYPLRGLELAAHADFNDARHFFGAESLARLGNAGFHNCSLEPQL